jgi:hypothetical protein
MKKLKFIALIGILAMALWAPAASAYYLEYTGERVSTDANQLFTHGEYGSEGNGFKITWDITEASAGAPFHYVYTLSGADGGALRKTLSHWILGVSANAVILDFSNFIPTYSGTYGVDTWPTGTANQGMPSPIYGIKWGSEVDYNKTGDPVANSLIYTFSFDTLRIPTWGDFYAKDGNEGGKPPLPPEAGNYAYNKGFGTVPGEDHTGFIMVPDTKTVVPLPGSVLLLGSGLLGLVGLGWRRRQTS